MLDLPSNPSVSDPVLTTPATAPEITQELVDSFLAGSGFPKAGRTLEQKIEEAQAFLDAEIPLTGTIGTGVAIVYNDQVVLSKGYGLQNAADSSSATNSDSMFQIGSITKTFIAVAIGLLVEDEKLQWRDPVKKHLPWLKLFDKYAEEHVTIGDLLSMNSGFARQPDHTLFSGQFKSEREFVEALELSEPEFSLREVPQYSNANYEILGQLIEEVSGKSWHEFLNERVWKPLGMEHTSASARLTPAELQKSSLTEGHQVRDDNMLGPYSLTSSLEAELLAGDATGLVAAGSIISSAADMATFTRFLLNKGTSGNAKLFKSPETVATMISGKNIATGDLIGAAPFFDFTVTPDGSTMAAGYGFDVVGDLMWGHAYAMKGGATAVQAADMSLAPRNGLGVVVLANTQGTVVKLSQIRSHVMGIFLDVPKDVLDFELKRKREAFAAMPKPKSELIPSCGLRFWKDPPHVTLTPEESEALVGSYTASCSPTYYSKLMVTRSSKENEFVFELNSIKASYFCVGSENTKWYFIASEPVSLGFTIVTAKRDENDGSFALDLEDLVFKK